MWLSPAKGESVTHVPGMECYLCVRKDTEKIRLVRVFVGLIVAKCSEENPGPPLGAMPIALL